MKLDLNLYLIIVKKNLNIKLILILLLFVGQNIFAQDKRNSYLWNNLSSQIQLNELYNLKVSTKTHYRLNDHCREMTYLDLAVSRKMNNWLKLGVAFRGAQQVKESGDIVEYRPQFSSSVSLHPQKIKIQSTNRIEHRFFSEGKGYDRYYHNIFVHFPFFSKLPKPYIGEELFTKFNDEGTHLGRIYGGLHLLERSHLTIDMYYVWQQLKLADKWQTADIFGMNLSFQI